MVQIKIKENSLQAKRMIEFLRTQSYVEFTEVEEKQDMPNEETIKAMQDAENGKVTRYKNSKEMFATLKEKANVSN